jgi:hypothetical protein
MIDRIRRAIQKDGSDNPHLNFSAYVLEALNAGLDVAPLRKVWLDHINDRRYTKGIFKRWPADNGKWSPKSISHDEVVGGIIPMSYLFNDAKEVKEIVEHGLTFGLYFSGRWTKKWWHPDTEWLIYWRPEFRAYFKLAQQKPLSFLEKWALKLNIMVSTDENMTRVKLLFLTLIDFEPKWTAKQMRKLDWQALRQYHRKNKIMLELWKI